MFDVSEVCGKRCGSCDFDGDRVAGVACVPAGEGEGTRGGCANGVDAAGEGGVGEGCASRSNDGSLRFDSD